MVPFSKVTFFVKHPVVLIYNYTTIQYTEGRNVKLWKMCFAFTHKNKIILEIIPYICFVAMRLFSAVLNCLTLNITISPHFTLQLLTVVTLSDIQ